MAKLFASRTAVEVTIEAVQVYGGYGYTTEYPVERYFRDLLRWNVTVKKACAVELEAA